MSNAYPYSPPSLLNMDDLLHKIGIQNFQLGMDLGDFVREQKSQPSYLGSDYSTKYLIMDPYGLVELEDSLQKNQYPVVVGLKVIVLKIRQSGCNENIDKTEKCNKKYTHTNLLLKDISGLKTILLARDLLCGGKLNAYVLHNYAYIPMPKEFWHVEENWYRLLADGSFDKLIPPMPEDYIV